MSSNSKVDYGNVKTTQIVFGGEKTTVTLAHGLEMRESLKDYLAKNAVQYDEFRKDMSDRLQDAPIWIDGESGLMRIGHWVLHNQADDLVLTNRLRTPTPVGAYVASLGRDSDTQKWYIKSVIFLKLFGRSKK